MRKAISAFILLAVSLSAQGRKIDDTLAIVGDQPLFRSEFEAVYNLYALQYRPDTISNPATRQQLTLQLKAQVFNDLLTTKLFYVAAKKDTSIHITDEQIAQQMESFITNIKTAIGDSGFNAILAWLGTDERGFRRMFRNYIKEQLYAQAYVDAHVRPKVQVSPQELDSLYEALKDSVTLTPTMVRFAHIFIAIKPSKSEEAAAKKTAEAIYKKLRSGADFAQMASNYSDDRETAQNGGYIGIVSRSDLPDSIAQKVFALQPGEISRPIKSPLGYNIFKCDNKNGDQIELSYILVKYNYSKADTQRALKRAQKVMQALRKGASFDSLAEIYSDDENTKELGGDLGWLQLNMLPSPLKDSLMVMKPGDVRGPLPMEQGFQIIKLIGIKEGQKMTKDQFSQLLYNQKLNEALQAEYQKLQKEIPIDIKVTAQEL